MGRVSRISWHFVRVPKYKTASGGVAAAEAFHSLSAEAVLEKFIYVGKVV